MVGQGGMGVVLKAFDEVLHRVVAIKVLAPQLATSASARKRFIREAQAAAAVCHEHVVAIHAVEEADGLPYLVMEYVAGQSLQDRLDQDGPLELEEILRIGMQTAAGLAAAHAQGLVHRDIKPANILLENGVPARQDHRLRPGPGRRTTPASRRAGWSPARRSTWPPNRPAASRSITAPTCSASAASSTRCAPASRRSGPSTTMAVLRQVAEETPRPVREVNPESPDWLAEIIAKLHAKDRADRFQSAAEVAELLGRHLAHLQRPGASVARRRLAIQARARPQAERQCAGQLPPHSFFSPLPGWA